MSSYITRWCRFHGEWDMDVDNVDECPKCIELGMTEVQQLREELTNLKESFARLREDRDMHSELRRDNHEKALRLLEENLELKKQLDDLVRRDNNL